MENLKNMLSELQIDFVGMRFKAAAVSSFMVIAAWVAFIVIGPNWGIDFRGGTEVQVDFEETMSIQEMRKALTSLGLPEDAVQTVGAEEDYTFLIRIEDTSFGMDEVEADIRSRLGKAFGDDWIKTLEANVEVGAVFEIDYAPAKAGQRVNLDSVGASLKGIDGAQVQEGTGEYSVRITVPGLSQAIQKKLESASGDRKMNVEKVESVGPKVGADLARQGAISVLATLGLVLVYVAFRFDIGFAPGAILALFHAVSITVGIFVLIGHEFNLPMIGALLTIVGYSLNDTIVIYDRIRENVERYSRNDMGELINVSINETLSRTLATSFTTMLAMAAFLILGGSVIQDFALAMMCGIVFGTYSTVFIASPMILVMQDVKPYLNKLVVSNASPEPGEEEGGPVGELTESEKRRRERADLENASTDNA